MASSEFERQRITERIGAQFSHHCTLSVRDPVRLDDSLCGHDELIEAMRTAWVDRRGAP